MTNQETKRVIEIYGPNYLHFEIPAYIRKRDLKKKSECCGARMLEPGQCESCGSNGKVQIEDWPEMHGAVLTKEGWQV